MTKPMLAACIGFFTVCCFFAYLYYFSIDDSLSRLFRRKANLPYPRLLPLLRSNIRPSRPPPPPSPPISAGTAVGRVTALLLHQGIQRKGKHLRDPRRPHPRHHHRHPAVHFAGGGSGGRQTGLFPLLRSRAQ
jgi:hypothetical protein